MFCLLDNVNRDVPQHYNHVPYYGDPATPTSSRLRNRTEIWLGSQGSNLD